MSGSLGQHSIVPSGHVCPWPQILGDTLGGGPRAKMYHCISTRLLRICETITYEPYCGLGGKFLSTVL